MELREKLTIQYEPQSIYLARYSPDDTALALASSDGTVQIHSAEDALPLTQLKSDSSAPVTCLRWRPGAHSAVLLCTTVDGELLQWQSSSGELLHKLQIEHTQILACDYDATGTKAAIGCKDWSVRIIDENTKGVLAELLGGTGNRLGHGNQVFTVKWLSADLLASAGWDNNIFIWDLREGCVVKYIHGPHICGESLDSNQDTLLTGSYHTKDQLQLWDWRTGNNLYTETLDSQEVPLMLYTAQFSKVDCGELFAVGGAGTGEVLFYSTSPCTQVLRSCGVGTVYSIDFSHTSDHVCFTLASGQVRIYRLVRNSSS